MSAIKNKKNLLINFNKIKNEKTIKYINSNLIHFNKNTIIDLNINPRTKHKPRTTDTKKKKNTNTNLNINTGSQAQRTP